MSMDDRRVFYKSKINHRGHKELDYIKTTINRMKLTTVSNMRITAAYANRPDLISLHSFGSYNYGWLISLHNKFLNPFKDYKLGAVIDIPSLDDYYRFYNRNKFKLTEEPYTKTFEAVDYYYGIYNDDDVSVPELNKVPLDPNDDFSSYPVTSVNGKTGDVVITKQDVILGNVKNYGIATEQQALDGTANNAYMTPLRTKQFVDNMLEEMLDNRIVHVVNNTTIDEGNL